MTDEKDNSSKIPNILFFCRDCQKVVPDPKKIGAKYAYQCPTCDSKNVAFGTKRSICDYFHLKEKDLV